MLGRKSRNPTAAYKTTAVATMHRSRLNTRMVYFHGIFLTNESTRNSELSNSLSAIGSRYCPSKVCWCKTRASSPSRASLNAAATRRPSAQSHCPSNTVMITKGMKIRRSSVIWFGAVQNWLFKRLPRKRSLLLPDVARAPFRWIFQPVDRATDDHHKRHANEGQSGASSDSDGFVSGWQPGNRISQSTVVCAFLPSTASSDAHHNGRSQKPVESGLSDALFASWCR